MGLRDDIRILIQSVKIKPFADLTVKEITSLRKKWRAIRSSGVENKSNQIEIQQVAKNRKEEDIKNIFASIPARRILFRNRERKFYSTGGNKSLQNLFDDIDVADMVIRVINSKEIAEVLVQASKNDVLIIPYISESILYNQLESKNTLKSILSLELMDKILDFSPENNLVRLQTGVKVKDLKTYLLGKGFELAKDIIGMEEYSILDVLHHRNLFYSELVHAEVLTPIGMVDISEDEPLKSMFLQVYQNLGVFSEITLKVRPIPVHVRKLYAKTDTFGAASELLKKMKENGLNFDSVRVFKYPHEEILFRLSTFQEEYIEESFFDKFFEEKSDKQNEPENTGIYLIFTFAEYEHSQSSTILKAKQTIQKLNGQVIATDEKEGSIDDFIKNFTLLKNQGHFKKLFFFSCSKTISVEKMDEETQNISRVIYRATLKTAHKLKYYIYFSKLNYPNIDVEVFVIGQIKSSKDIEIYKTAYQFLKRSMKQEHKKKDAVNSSILSFIKDKTDTYHILQTLDYTNSKY